MLLGKFWTYLQDLCCRNNIFIVYVSSMNQITPVWCVNTFCFVFLTQSRAQSYIFTEFIFKGFTFNYISSNPTKELPIQTCRYIKDTMKDSPTVHHFNRHTNLYSSSMIINHLITLIWLESLQMGLFGLWVSFTVNCVCWHKWIG